jgi:uncharacterized protein YndB with AHSA1/START domain
MSSFCSDRAWSFDDGREVVWRAMARTDHFDRWWPWLRDFDPGDGLHRGATWRCAVVPPLPYVVAFELHLHDVVDGHRVTAAVSGDVVGTATLVLASIPGGGTSVRLSSELRPASTVLRSFGAVARPLVQWGHDWVLDQGVQQFARRALGPVEAPVDERDRPPDRTGTSAPTGPRDVNP